MWPVSTLRADYRCEHSTTKRTSDALRSEMPEYGVSAHEGTVKRPVGYTGERETHTTTCVPKATDNSPFSIFGVSPVQRLGVLEDENQLDVLPAVPAEEDVERVLVTEPGG